MSAYIFKDRFSLFDSIGISASAVMFSDEYYAIALCTTLIFSTVSMVLEKQNEN
jgi:hypothetical protein